MIEFYPFKIIALGFSQAPVLKYSIFWSGNATEILKKAYKYSIFGEEIKILKIFLMIAKDEYLKNDLEKKF